MEYLERSYFTIAIVVCDSNGSVLYEELNKKYIDNECVEVIPYSALNEENISDLFLFVGDINTNIADVKGKFIDLTDLKLMHLVDEKNVNMVSGFLIDGIVACVSGYSLIGVDLEDLLGLMQNYETIHIGFINSKEAIEPKAKAEKLISKAQLDISKCCGIYLSLQGDVSLYDASDMLEEFAATVKETNIIVTAIYDELLMDEYNVMAFFMCNANA